MNNRIRAKIKALELEFKTSFPRHDVEYATILRNNRLISFLIKENSDYEAYYYNPKKYLMLYITQMMYNFYY